MKLVSWSRDIFNTIRVDHVYSEELFCNEKLEGYCSTQWWGVETFHYTHRDIAFLPSVNLAFPIMFVWNEMKIVLI